AGLLKLRQVNRLLKRSSKNPDSAQRALRRARRLREAIHGVFWPIIRRQPVPAVALDIVNEEIRSAAKHLRVVRANGGFEWGFDDVNDFDSLLWVIARSAGELLASDQLPLVRACSSNTCQWFFLDTSKNHHR